MLEKIGSFLLACWAEFLELVEDLSNLALFKSKLTPAKEATMSDFYTPKELRENLKDFNFRLKIAEWIEGELRPLGIDSEYARVAKLGGIKLTGQQLTEILNALEAYVGNGTRGHGKGHRRRDLAHAYAIAMDSFKNPAIFPAEALAGFIAGAFHDFAASFTVRYHDKFYCVGHAEEGAWAVYHILRQYLPEHICRLIAYAIAAHGHYTTDFVSSEDKMIRKTWNDTIFKDGSRWVRLAVWLCRMADRLDNLGAAHMARHIDANADGCIYGGANLRPDGGWDKLDMSSLMTLLIPEFKTSDGKSTTFVHLLGYGASAYALNPVYNIHDHFFPNMELLKARKLEEIVLIVNSLNGKSDKNPDLGRLVTFLDRVEMLDMDGTQLDLITTAWENLSEAEQAKWVPILDTAEACYSRWLELLKDTVTAEELFPGFDNEALFNEYLK